MKAGSCGAWLSTVAGQILRGVQTRSAADIARELDIRWVVHRNVQDQLDYREVHAHWMPKNPTDDDKDFVGLYGSFCIHWTSYTDQRDSFGAETG